MKAPLVQEASRFRVFILLLAVLLLSCVDLFKDPEAGTVGDESTGEIYGKVVSEDGKPVAGVVARLVALEKEDVTGEDGIFSIEVPRQQAVTGLAKTASVAIDTLVLSYKGQPFYIKPLITLAQELGTLIMASKEVMGDINSLGADGIVRLSANLSTAESADKLNISIGLMLDQQTGSFYGKVYYLFTTDSLAYLLNITAYNSNGNIVFSNYMFTFTHSTIPVPIGTVNFPVNPNVGACQKDPLNPCTPECADLRTVDYRTKIAPIWEANACVTGCHIRGSQGFNNTGNLRRFKVRQGGKDTTVYRGLSFQPDLNALSMMINVPMYSDSGNPNVPFWRVRPFYPDSSYLVRILSAANGTFVRMPNALPPIPETSLNDIKQWIKEGACPEL